MLKFKFLTLLATLTLCSVGGSAFANGSPSKAALEKAQQFKESYLRLSQAIPESMHDIDALAEEMDYDIGEAIEYVTKEVRYEPYMGVMRGAQGAMISASGSAWDQALLLASLISAMGGEFLIAEGRLSDSDARKLIKKTFLPRAELDTPISPQDIEKAFVNTLNESQIDKVKQAWGDTSSDAKLNKVSNQVSNQLIDILDKNGISNVLQIRSDNEIVKQVSSDYAWVMYRETPSSEWQNIHPAFEGSEPQVKIERYADNVRVNQKTHTLAINIFVEKQQNNKFTEEKIIAEYKKPIANLAAAPLTINIVSNGSVLSQEADFLIPIINGQLAKKAKAILPTGVLINAQDMMTGPSVVATLGRKFSGGLNELGSTGEKKSKASRATGIIMSFTYTLPDGTRFEQRRRIVDLRNLDETKSSDLELQSVIDINVGHDNGAQRLEHRLKYLSEASLLMPYKFAYIGGQLDSRAYLEKTQNLGNLSSLYWGDMQDVRSNYLPQKNEKEFGIQRTAFIAMQRLINIREKEKTLRVMDILFNQSRVLELNDGIIKESKMAVLHNGVRETIAEQAMNFKGIDAQDYTPQFFIKSRLELNAWLSNTSANNSVKERLTADFDEAGLISGYVNKQGEIHWWRIHQESGNVLGMSQFGGSAATEGLELELSFINNIISSGYFIKGAAACQSEPAGPSRVCCHVGNAAMAGAGFIAGNGIQGMIAKKWTTALGVIETSSRSIFAEVAVNEIGGVLGNDLTTNCKAKHGK